MSMLQESTTAQPQDSGHYCILMLLVIQWRNQRQVPCATVEVAFT